MTSFVVIYGVIIHQLTWTLTRTRHLFTKRSQRLVSPSLRQPVCLLYLETWKSDMELLLLLLLGKVGWRGSSAALSWQQLGIQKTWKERVKFQNKRSCSPRPVSSSPECESDVLFSKSTLICGRSLVVKTDFWQQISQDADGTGRNLAASWCKDVTFILQHVCQALCSKARLQTSDWAKQKPSDCAVSRSTHLLLQIYSVRTEEGGRRCLS